MSYSLLISNLGQRNSTSCKAHTLHTDNLVSDPPNILNVSSAESLEEVLTKAGPKPKYK